MRRCARARRDGSISRERRSSSGGRKEDGRSPTLRGISQDEHESITCSSRLTFILGLANERIPSFQFVLLFPLQSSGGTSVPHIPPPCGPVELPSPRADLFSCPSLRRTRRDNVWSPRPRSGRKLNGRAAEPPPEPSPGHVPRCERAISPTYAAKPGLTCTAACRFLCRTASDQARRASGRWPKGGLSEPPASFRGAGRPELCQSRFNSERHTMCCKKRRLWQSPARSGGAFRGGDKARTGITPRRSSGRSVGRDRRPPKTAKPTFFAAHRMAKPCGRTSMRVQTFHMKH